MDNSNLSLSDDGFLFNSYTGDSFTLNAVATFILKRMIDGVGDDLIIQALVAEYDVAEETAAGDLARFREELFEMEIIKKVISPILVPAYTSNPLCKRKYHSSGCCI